MHRDFVIEQLKSTAEPCRAFWPRTARAPTTGGLLGAYSRAVCCVCRRVSIKARRRLQLSRFVCRHIIFYAAARQPHADRAEVPPLVCSRFRVQGRIARHPRGASQRAVTVRVRKPLRESRALGLSTVYQCCKRSECTGEQIVLRCRYTVAHDCRLVRVAAAQRSYL